MIKLYSFRWVPGFQLLRRQLILAGRDANSLAFCYAPRILQIVSARAAWTQGPSSKVI